jgi:hypothetical protein
MHKKLRLLNRKDWVNKNFGKFLISSSTHHCNELPPNLNVEKSRS